MAAAHELHWGKPAMRGSLHLAAFYLSLGAGLMLIAIARTSLSRVASIVYVLSLTGLFGISALYHRPHWGMGPRMWLRRLDHSSIFFLIAGSSTPILLLGLDNDRGRQLLWAMWIAAAIGVFKCFFWSQAPRFLNVVLYVGVAFISIPCLPGIEASLGRFETSLLVWGGVIYVLGAVIYFFKKPNPFPRTFGYHEIFHALVVVASILHFKVIYDLVRAA